MIVRILFKEDFSMNRKIAKVITRALILVLVFSMLSSLASCGMFAEKPQYDLFDSEGLLAVENEDGEWGYINKKGKEVIKCKYDSALPFSEGLAAVCEDGEWGYINKKGKEVIDFKYDSAYPFDKDGFAIVVKDGKYGFINKDGDFEIKAKYESLEIFNDFDLCIAKKDGLFGVIDRKGETVVGFKYKRISSFTDDGYAVVTDEEGLCGLVDKKGQTVIKVKYDVISAAGDNMFAKNGLVLVGNDGKYGFFNEKGKQKIDFDFTYASSFADNGLAVVAEVEDDDEEDSFNLTTAKWGYIDKSGEYVIDPEFDEARSFAKNGLAAVCEDGEWGYINKKGDYVIDTEFDSASSFNEETDLATVGIKDKNDEMKYGVINKSGKIVIEAEYDDIDIFETCIAAADEDTYILFSLSGKEIESYDDIDQATYDCKYLIVANEEEQAIITSKGKIKFDFTDEYNIMAITDDGYVVALDEDGAYVFLKSNGKKAFDTKESYTSCLPYAYIDMYFNQDLYY